METFLAERKIEFVRIAFSGKKDYVRATMQTRKFLKKNRTDIVHCHMRDANFIGLTAAKLSSIKKRIYTRHHSTYNHLYFPKAVKFDKAVNQLATEIVVISDVVKKTLLKEDVPESKLTLINHGFNLSKFKLPDQTKVNELRIKYNLDGTQPVIGVIARYIDWKGHQFIIEAFARLKKTYPQAVFVFANAVGPQQVEIKKMILGRLDSSAIEIPFEEDLFSLYQLFDVYVHAPINANVEAFGQTYVEALAAGIPSVFTISGIANEFIVHEENALVVPHEDSASITTKSVEKFNLTDFIQKLEALYV